MNWFIIASALLSVSVFAQKHEVDPKVTALPYSIYGEESVEMKGDCQTARRGWVGSGAELILGSSGGGPCEINGDIQSIGTMDGKGTIVNASLYLDGHLTSSNIVLGDSSQVDSEDAWATYSPDSLMLVSDTTITQPVFHTSNYYPDGVHDPEAADDCNFSGSGWQCGGVNYGDTLPPGTYGTVSSSDSGYFAPGEYYIDNLNLASSGGIIVDKDYADVTRIIVRRGFDTNPSSFIQASKKNDYGKILIYLDGANSAGATIAPGSRVDATLYAPFSDVTINPNTTFNGQIIAKSILAHSGFNGLLGRFIPFQSPQIRFGTPLTIEEEGGTRLVSIPVELSRVSEAPASVQYEIIFETGTDKARKFDDINASQTVGGSGNTGTIFFRVGEDVPKYPFLIQIIDDQFKENTETFIIRLYDPNGALFWSNLDELSETFSIIDNDADGVQDTTTTTPDDSTTTNPQDSITNPDDSTTQVDTNTTVTSTDSTLVGVDTNGANIHDGIIYTNQEQVIITLEDGTIDTLYVADIVDDTITYYDPSLGDSSKISVVYDTIAPVVEILNLSDSSTLNQLNTQVSWTIDGIAQDTLTSEELVEGEYLVIREAWDLAGNYGADTVVIYVIIPTIDVSTSLETELIRSTQAQSIEEISQIKGREVQEDEVWSFSFLDNSSEDGLYTEVMVGHRTDPNNPKNDQVETFDNPQSYDPSQLHSPQINLNLTLPISRDINGVPGTGVCVATGEPRWDHYIENILIYEYDHLGQFVNRFEIPGPVQIVGVEQFQDDQGKLQALLELPMVDGNLRSWDGRILGSGVYILQIHSRIRSVPNATCNSDKILLNVNSSMHRMGYQHPQN